MPELKKLSTIFKEIGDLSSKKEKIAKLTNLRNIPAAMVILKTLYDENITFSIPEGAPPYKVAEDMVDDHGGLYRDYRKIKYFLDDPRNTVNPLRRESLFIEMLESLHPDEASLLLQIKDNKALKGLTKKTISEALPELFK